MIPFFKQNQYNAGITAGLSAIAKQLGGQLKEVPQYTVPQSPDMPTLPFGVLFLIFILAFIIFPYLLNRRYKRNPYYSYDSRSDGSFLIGYLLGELLGSKRGRNRRNNRRDDNHFDDFTGGFGGGDGGGFSGGGASGKW